MSINLSHCTTRTANNPIVSIYQGLTIDKTQFCHEVSRYYQTLIHSSLQNYALFYDEAYPFSVQLFALLHAGKTVWIAPNNKAKTASQLIQQDCVLIGDWQGQQQALIPAPNPTHLTTLDVDHTELIIFTSGSTGQAKAIPKTLPQFQAEINVLESMWGNKLGQAQALATVSHQHIYGLLFRVLWPLATERCFHSTLYLSPEPLLKASQDKSCYWISSPAQQKRLDELSSWAEITQLNAIFSAGSALAVRVAEQVFQYSQQSIIEVYGSSETGGIAWREAIYEPRWTCFQGVSMQPSTDNLTCLHSDFLTAPYLLDDKIKTDRDGLFSLAGRRDRIVKVEEKRLSLDEMEHVLTNIHHIQAAYCLLQQSHRDVIVATLVLTEQGHTLLITQGRATFIKQLRQQLMHSFETVVIPRKWVFMNTLPLTQQGKINQSLIKNLVCLDSHKFPQLQFCQQENNTVNLQLRIQAELIYFDGHFPEQPILAGIAQLAWAEQYGRLFFNIDLPFLRMEVIKFKKIIQPNDIIRLTLSWNVETGKLYFELNSATESHASGRLLYGIQT